MSGAALMTAPSLCVRQKAVPEETDGDRAHAHQSLVEFLRRVRRPLLRPVRFTELDDGVLAEVVGDRLGWPLRVAVDGPARRVADRARRGILTRALARARVERDVLGEVAHRL